MRDSRIRRDGITLVEVLAVISIIGILVGLLLPAVQRARESAARIQCLNQMRQMGVALHNYHGTYGRLPPSATTTSAKDPNRMLSWMALILPQMEQAPLWTITVDACSREPDASVNPPHVGYAAPMASYACPSDGRCTTALTTPTGDRAAFTSYIGNGGTIMLVREWGVLGPEEVGPRFTDISDGTSQTVMVGERPPPDSLQAGRWYTYSPRKEPFGGPDVWLTYPELKSVGDTECEQAGSGFGPGQTQNPCDRFHFWSLHPGGANFLFADGSARFMPYSAALILPALMTRSGAEVISMPD